MYFKLRWGFISFIAFCGLTKGQKNSPDEVEKLMDLTQKRILDLEANVDELIQKSSLPNLETKARNGNNEQFKT